MACFLNSEVVKMAVILAHLLGFTRRGVWQGIRLLRRALGTPEQLARLSIDRMLDLAGWSVQDLQPPDVIAAEIAENLQAALVQFSEIHEDLTYSASEQRRAGNPLT